MQNFLDTPEYDEMHIYELWFQHGRRRVWSAHTAHLKAITLKLPSNGLDAHLWAFLDTPEYDEMHIYELIELNVHALCDFPPTLALSMSRWPKDETVRSRKLPQNC